MNFETIITDIIYKIKILSGLGITINAKVIGDIAAKDKDERWFQFKNRKGLGMVFWWGISANLIRCFIEIPLSPPYPKKRGGVIFYPWGQEAH